MNNETELVAEICALRAELDVSGEHMRALQSELATIKAQAGDSTEYVLAQVNRELRETNSALILDALTAQSQAHEQQDRIAELEGVIKSAHTHLARRNKTSFDCAWYVLSEALPNE